MGNTEAIASTPKPSRAPTDDPIPNPMAKTSGTIGPVVTPALSQAKFTKSSLDMKVKIEVTNKVESA